MPASSTQRYALVTGAGSGLGRAFCLRLAREGWHVAVTDIDLVAAEKTKALLVAAGGNGQVELLDVTSGDAWRRLAERLRCDWPRLDLLINNAGICASGEIGEASLENFQRVMEVNFDGVLLGCHTMVPWLRETGPPGHIVNIASIFGLVAPASMGAYNTSKAGVVALSETLDCELKSHGIGVTVVAPGFFESQLIRRGQFATEQQQQIAEQYLQKAQLTADEVVEHTLAAVRRKQLYVVLGRKARWIWRLKRWMPSRFAKLMAWRYARKLRKCNADD
ncbi:MAG: SDR family NAD(P)-dependent oxidoreductase [Bythopirellula sp.]